MADGTTKPIEQLKPGDWVISRNPDTGKTEPEPVLQVFSRQSPVLVSIILTDAKSGTSETITSTPDHPYYIEGKTWIAAGGLNVGDKIVDGNGTDLVVKSITWQRDEKSPFTVYNLTVQDDHSYFIGTLNGGAWVHNSCEDVAQYLTKELISQGRRIPGEIRAIPRLVEQYGGRAANWSKKVSGILEHPETGEDVEIHWYENLKDGIGRVEHKWKFDPGQ
jgi:hypothetical protein